MTSWLPPTTSFLSAGRMVYACNLLLRISLGEWELSGQEMPMKLTFYLWGWRMTDFGGEAYKSLGVHLSQGGMTMWCDLCPLAFHTYHPQGLIQSWIVLKPTCFLHSSLIPVLFPSRPHRFHLKCMFAKKIPSTWIFMSSAFSKKPNLRFYPIFFIYLLSWHGT